MYPVDLHTHTVASTHAYSTIHDYIAVAKAKGVKLFANTDHGPAMPDGPHPWHFGNLIVVPRIVDGVGILRGIEANIMNDQGETDCNEHIRSKLDFVIAGFHEPVLAPQDKAYNTRAMIAVIKSGLVQIISHPGNPHYPIDIASVARAAADYNVALELNDSSFYRSRLGSGPNCRKIVEAVKESGGWLSLGSDSHISYTLADYSHCSFILEEVDFPVERILNASVIRTLDFIQQHSGKAIDDFTAL